MSSKPTRKAASSKKTNKPPKAQPKKQAQSSGGIKLSTVLGIGLILVGIGVGGWLLFDTYFSPAANGVEGGSRLATAQSSAASASSPDLIQPAESGESIYLDLPQNAFLTDLPRVEISDWVNVFVPPRAPHPLYMTVDELDLTTNVYGVGVDERGLIWAPPDNAGHFRRSGRPGEGTNIVMVGHSGTGRVFSPLLDAQEGTVVTLIDTNGTPNPYTVNEIVVLPVRDATPEQQQANLAYVQPTETEVLTLILCFPRDDYGQRMIIRAVPSA